MRYEIGKTLDLSVPTETFMMNHNQELRGMP